MSDATVAYEDLPDGVYIIDDDAEAQIREIGAWVIDGVAYPPLTVHFLCNYDDDRVVACQTCEWERTVGSLPSDSGTVMPPLCPACLKRDDTISGVRADSRGAMEAVDG